MRDDQARKRGGLSIVQYGLCPRLSCGSHHVRHGIDSRFIRSSSRGSIALWPAYPPESPLRLLDLGHLQCLESQPDSHSGAIRRNKFFKGCDSSEGRFSFPIKIPRETQLTSVIVSRHIYLSCRSPTESGPDPCAQKPVLIDRDSSLLGMQRWPVAQRTIKCNSTSLWSRSFPGRERQDGLQPRPDGMSPAGGSPKTVPVSRCWTGTVPYGYVRRLLRRFHLENRSVSRDPSRNRWLLSHNAFMKLDRDNRK